MRKKKENINPTEIVEDDGGAWIETHQFNDVKDIYQVGDKAELSYISPGEGSQRYSNSIEDICVTKEFQQDSAEWSEFMMPNLIIDNGRITNGYSLVYITGTVENLSDSDLDYYATNVAVAEIDGDIVSDVVSDPDYYEEVGMGKTAYKTTIAPKEKFTYHMGFIIDDRNLKNQLFVNMAANYSDASSYVLVPIELN